MVDIPDYLSRAEKALKQGELDMAERYYNQVLSVNPENQDAHAGKKQVKIRRAQSGSPIGWWFQLLKGYALVSIGKAADAYPTLDMIHHTHPDNSFAASLFARAAEAHGNTTEAHQVYTAILKRTPDNRAVLRRDADLLIGMEEYEKATERLKRLLALQPNNDKLEHQLRDISALSYSRSGIPKKLTERRAQMEKAKLEALDAPEFMDQLEELQHQYEQEPDNHELGVQIAKHLRQGKHFAEASKMLGSILDADAAFTPARREQAMVWFLMGELGIAASLYEELLAETPHDMALKQEYYTAQLALLGQKLSEEPGSADLVSRIETMKIERDKHRITQLQAVLRERPESFPERAELGELLKNHGRVDEAIETIQRLLHEPSWGGRGYLMLGLCFHAKGDRSLAVMQLEKAIPFFQDTGYGHTPTPDLKETWYRIGLIREEMNEPEKAREAYGQVYSVDVNFRDVKKRYEGLFNSTTP